MSPQLTRVFGYTIFGTEQDLPFHQGWCQNQNEFQIVFLEAFTEVLNNMRELSTVTVTACTW